MKVVPAILENNFEMIEKKVLSAKENGLDEVQIDIADGIFVTNKTFNDLGLIFKFLWDHDMKGEIHLMVVNCLEKMPVCKKAKNVTRAIVHLEALTAIVTAEILRKPEKIAIAINPITPLENSYELISRGLLGHILFMGVTPGFSGQAFHPEVAEKIRKFKSKVKKGITCAVDGGVNAETARLVKDHVDWINASSFIWNSDGTMNRINLNYLISL